jgi:hypothetical protein
MEVNIKGIFHDRVWGSALGSVRFEAKTQLVS